MTPDLLAHALDYAATGWHVFPCHTPIERDGTTICSCSKGAACPEKTQGKHPRTIKGLTDATRDPEQIRKWWTMWPTANIGGIPASANLIAFDLDTDAALATAQTLGLFAEPTREVRTGNGTHRYYANSHPLTTGALVKGLVVRSGHGYVLLPPSLHRSGRRYEWVDASVPYNSLPPAAEQAVREATSPEAAKERVALAIHQQRIPAGERHGTLLALAGSLASAGVRSDMALQLVLDANTSRCDPPKPSDEVRRLVEYAYEQEHAEHAANAAHLFQPVVVADDAPRVALQPTSSDPLAQPLPGILEQIARYHQETAPYHVRPYAVASALALGSTLCARRYATSAANFTSLYFLVAGKSGTGKEHVRKVIGRVLRAIDAPNLIGANTFTSASAIFTSLLAAPQQVAVIDEMGQFLGAATGFGESSGRKDEVLTTMMELYGRLDDFAQTPQYAGLTLSKAQAEQAKRKTIERPALTFVGLTTPDMWYGALESTRIASGFLNRFCVIELENYTRSRRQPTVAQDVPDLVQAWGRQVLSPLYELDSLTKLTELAAPRTLAITETAARCFGSFEDYCASLADRLERERLGELPMRSAEQAMRLALMAALAVDPDADAVDSDAAEWGVLIAGHMLAKLVPAVRDRMADNPLAKLRKRFLAAVAEAGPRGLTGREIQRLSMFTGVTSRERAEVISWAKDAGGCVEQMQQSPNGGRVRHALILPVSSEADAA